MSKFLSTLNERQNVDSKTERKIRKPNSIKIKRAVTSEWKRNKTKLLRNAGHASWSFKRGIEISAPQTRPPCGATDGQKYFMSFSSGKYLTFWKDAGLWEISVNKEFWVCGNLTSSETRKSLKLLQNVVLKNLFWFSSHYQKTYDDLLSLIYNTIVPHCHNSFFTTYSYLNKNDFKPVVLV